MQEQEVVITKSTSRFWRAGTGLLYFPFAAVAAVLAHQAWPFSGPVVATVVFLSWFSVTLSRIAAKDGAITLTLPFSIVTIAANQMASARLWCLRPNRFGIGFVCSRGGFPLPFHFTVISHTDLGDFDQTSGAIKRLLLATNASTTSAP